MGSLLIDPLKMIIWNWQQNAQAKGKAKEGNCIYSKNQFACSLKFYLL